MKILYFAWLRSKVGTAEENLDPPADVATVGALLDWLKDRSPRHAEALADLSVVRVAVNQDYARANDPVSSDDEVALFPPVTGG
ncbi:MAG TPA: molybdopterin converting factor subunit 1 [Alphaproteobacteria bacterium]|nr:molybdopterin converting factor subunit 1 [Alphaproteobacteria bacterium]